MLLAMRPSKSVQLSAIWCSNLYGFAYAAPGARQVVGLWGFLWVSAGFGGFGLWEKRMPKWCLKSQILALFDFWKHPARSKTTSQQIRANIEEHGYKKGRTKLPEIAYTRTVWVFEASYAKQAHITGTLRNHWRILLQRGSKNMSEIVDPKAVWVSEALCKTQDHFTET